MRRSIIFHPVSNRLAVTAVALGIFALGILPERVARARQATAVCRDNPDCYRLLQEANRLFVAGQFAPALPLWKQIYYQYGDLKVLYQIAFALVRLGQPADAVPFCQLLLDAEIVTDKENLEKIQKLKETAEAAASQSENPAGQTAFPSDSTKALPPESASAILLGPLLPSPVSERRGPVPLYQRWWLWTAVGATVTIGVAVTALSVLYAPPNWLGATRLRPFP